MLQKIKKLTGIWFGKKDPKKEVTKAEEMLQLYLKYIPQIRGIMNGDIREAQTDGEIIGRMYDYYEDVMDGLTSPSITPSVFDAQHNVNVVTYGGAAIKDERIEATPMSVMTELETVPVPFTLEDLDKKITTLKDKTKLLNQRFAKEQIEGLCKRLENRKHYRDNVEFYSAFPNTTDEKIDILLGKYKLVMKESDLFVPTFPDEAVKVMKEYSAVTEKISGESPVYYVIAEQKDFEKKYKKLDPILLAQSPFGFYWQILGAWDKEMLLLSEL